MVVGGIRPKKKPHPEGEACVARTPTPANRLLRKLLLRFDGFDHHEFAHGALIHELDAAGDLGEKRVVFAATHVESGLYASAALTNDDGAARYDLPAECFKAEPLRIRIAAIS